MNRPAAHSTRVRVRMLLFVAARNVWRNPLRSVLTVSALAGGLVIVILYSALLEGMTRQMIRYATEVSTGSIQVHRRAYVDDQDLYATLPWRYLETMERNLAGIRVAPRLYAAALASTEENSTGVLIRAVDAAREPLVTRMLGHVRHGEPDLGVAQAGDDGVARYNVIVGAQLAKNMNIQPGSELVLVSQAADGSIGNALYRVAGALSPVEPNFDRLGVLMSIEAYQQLMYLEDGFHELAVAADDPSRVDELAMAVADELRRLQAVRPLDELGGDALVRTWRQLTPAIADMLALSKSMLLIIGLIVVTLASLGMLNTMLMAVHERTHEFGILLAIGMKRRWLLFMVLCESLLLALASVVVGTVAGVVAGRFFEDPGIDFSASLPDGYDWAGIVFEPVLQGRVEPGSVLYACALLLIVAMLASVIPSWRTIRLEPAEVMR